MIQLWNKTKTSVVGIDFGTCSLRAVQLVDNGDGWRVFHWINIEDEPTSAEPPTINHAVHLKPAFGPGAFSGRVGSVVLGPPDVEYKLLEVPPPVLEKPPAEMREVLQFELERHMPWPASESEVAAWPVQSGATSAANALVVATRTESVQRYLDVLNAAQAECICAEIVPNAVTLSCRREPQPRSSNATSILWGVLDMGFTSCRLYLIHDDCPIFARVLKHGGRDWTETLAQALHVTFPIAEHYKRLYGLEATERGFRSMVGGPVSFQEDALPGILYAILRQYIESMVAEIERSYRFALGRLSNTDTGSLFLIGGGARLRGFPEILGSQLGLKVDLPMPSPVLLPGQLHNPKSDHPALYAKNFAVLASCFGLALMEDYS